MACSRLIRYYITLYRCYLLYFHCYSTHCLASELKTLLLNIAEIASTSIGRNFIDITQQFYLRMETDPVLAGYVQFPCLWKLHCGQNPKVEPL